MRTIVLLLCVLVTITATTQNEMQNMTTVDIPVMHDATTQVNTLTPKFAKLVAVLRELNLMPNDNGAPIGNNYAPIGNNFGSIVDQGDVLGNSQNNDNDNNNNNNDNNDNNNDLLVSGDGNAIFYINVNINMNNNQNYNYNNNIQISGDE